MWTSSLLLTIIACGAVSANDNLRVAYEWKQIDYEYPSLQERQFAISNGAFRQENVIPVGIEVYKNRLFFTLPRSRPGVPASLAYVAQMNDTSTKSPPLRPYPTWTAHADDETPEIVSAIRIKVDNCGRLWVLDSGLNGNRKVRKARVLIYDLHDDNLLRTHEFADDQIKDESELANIAVEDDECRDAFAYIADMGKPGLIVYSWRMEKSWRMTHNFFNPEPTAGNFSIKNIPFQWNYGLFGLALSKAAENDHAQLYFHPYVSIDEFVVSTKFLKNESMATSSEIYHNFRKIGTRGPNGQSNAQFLDKKTGVLFYTLPNLNAVACWRTTSKEYNVKSQGRIFMNETLMEFPSDVKVDDQSRLWVISNRYQKYLFSRFDPSEINFRVMTATVAEAVDHTACDPKTKSLPDIINKLSDLINTTKAPPTSTKSAADRAGVASFALLVLLLTNISLL